MKDGSSLTQVLKPQHWWILEAYHWQLHTLFFSLGLHVTSVRCNHHLINGSVNAISTAPEIEILLHLLLSIYYFMGLLPPSCRLATDQVGGEQEKTMKIYETPMKRCCFTAIQNQFPKVGYVFFLFLVSFC